MTVEGRVVGAIGVGWLALIGVGAEDSQADAEYLADRTAQLRAFPDSGGKMNLSVIDVKGAVLAVSQFTLYGDCRKGRRPGFSDAAPPAKAVALYEQYMTRLATHGIAVAKGQFQAHMKVSLVNDGPVTLLLDSKKSF